MSVEEDTELKNLVAHTLENKGILPKIRAELRANVFLALEENPATKETLLKNDELSAFVKIPVGTLILNLIREFLEFFELEFTLSVFDPETKYGKDYSSIAKDKMMQELKLTDCKKNPLLYEVIERVINVTELKVSNNEKVSADFSPTDLSGSGDCGYLAPSPGVLNSTYVKQNKTEIDSVLVSPIEKPEKRDEDYDESIKEELISNNISESNSLEEPKINEIKSPENSDGILFINNNSKESKENSPNSVSKEAIEIDLLTFTPVKETKSKEKVKSSEMQNSNEVKANNKTDSSKTLSVLGDLPPLTSKPDERSGRVNEIKAIMDKWQDLDKDDESLLTSRSSKGQPCDDKGSPHLNSDRSDCSQHISQKSDKTEVAEDFEEDISDLINGHTPSDSQLTVDETISKVSCGADYMESL